MASEYVVLRSITRATEDATWEWREIGRDEASTPKAAIRAVTSGKPAAERTGTFVAVPVRSFQPVTRRVQSVEKDEWS